MHQLYESKSPDPQWNELVSLIWDSHIGDYEEYYYLLGCYAV
jgi:hypothetical protein